MYARASSGLITILPSMTSSGADSAPSGTHLLSWQSDYPPHKSISPSTLHIQKRQTRHSPAIRIGREFRKKKKDGRTCFLSALPLIRHSTASLYRLPHHQIPLLLLLLLCSSSSCSTGLLFLPILSLSWKRFVCLLIKLAAFSFVCFCVSLESREVPKVFLRHWKVKRVSKKWVCCIRMK